MRPKHAYKVHVLTGVPFMSLFKDDIIKDIEKEYEKKLKQLAKDIKKTSPKDIDKNIKGYTEKIVAWAIVLGSSL